MSVSIFSVMLLNCRTGITLRSLSTVVLSPFGDKKMVISLSHVFEMLGLKHR